MHVGALHQNKSALVVSHCIPKDFLRWQGNYHEFLVEFALNRISNRPQGEVFTCTPGPQDNKAFVSDVMKTWDNSKTGDLQLDEVQVRIS